jgi:hypothetical protein
MSDQWEKPMGGTLIITNPDTLEKWIHSGKIQKKLDLGYKYHPGCGRFVNEPCKCRKCRNLKSTNPRLIVLNRHFKPPLEY